MELSLALLTKLGGDTKNIQRRERQNQTGGGLLIYTKENVNISRIIQLENNLDESFWVQIHAKIHLQNVGRNLFCF
jgi:hypothetical protein